MAPELYEINDCVKNNRDEECFYDETVDLWAVGMITYHMISAQFPFKITG